MALRQCEGDTAHRRHEEPNAFGLYDMLGNVAEWTFDLYAENRYAEWGAKATQPVALPTDKRYPHPTRGGSFIEAADKLRYANRQASHEDWSQRDPQVPQSIYWHTDADHVGFRVVRALDEQANLKGFKSQGDQGERGQASPRTANAERRTSNARTSLRWRSEAS